MFLRRAARRSAAALDHSFMSPGSFLLRVTLTLRKGRTLHRSVRVSVGGVESTLAHLGKQQQQQQQQQPDLVPSPGFINTDCRHLNRVAPVAVNPSISLLSDGGQSHIFRRLLVHANRRHSSSSRGGSLGNVMFTCNWEVSSPRCSARTTQQVRASSTATKKRDAAEVEAADSNNKGEEQILREASTTTSSYTVKAPGESEPEEGKPSKTQQLKKVFKEYGAVGVSFHIGISLMSLGMFYLLVSSGIDIAALLCKLGFSEAIVQSKMAAGTSTFVLAYAIHKLFAPVRISITLVSVPLIVRYFRKTGLFKPPAP